MKIVIGGSTGMIGKELTRTLESKGHLVIQLVRDKDQLLPNTVLWDPELGSLDINAIEGADAIINLSGENIARKRWSETQKKKILDSRLNATKTLVSAMLKMEKPPKTFISGSAIGFYGNGNDNVCTETTRQGKGFLADVCGKWEKAAMPAATRGIRTIFLRTGVVFSPDDGALAKMAPLFKLGFGGKLGSGRQDVSWITLEDLIRVIIFILEHPHIEGPVNAVAPNSVTNSELTKTLSNVLHRPAFLPVPAFILRLMLGTEMANEIILGSLKVVPLQLQNGGFRFKYPELKKYLEDLYGKSRKPEI